VSLVVAWLSAKAEEETDEGVDASVADVGVEGRGFTVMLERALSVLEPVIVLKREPASFRVIVTSATERAGAERRDKEAENGDWEKDDGHSHSPFQTRMAFGVSGHRLQSYYLMIRAALASR